MLNKINEKIYKGDINLKKYKIGYTTGVFDMFHIGHLNILKNSKQYCDYLIVGISTDELVSYKNQRVVIPLQDRMKIVESIRYVDKVVVQETMNKIEAWNKYKFDVMFVGSDWKGTDKWIFLEEQFSKLGVDIIYFPYTKGISSTELRSIIKQ